MKTGVYRWDREKQVMVKVSDRVPMRTSGEHLWNNALETVELRDQAKLKERQRRVDAEIMADSGMTRGSKFL